MIIDVVIPAYNEADRIVPTLSSYAEVLSQWDSRLLVVDDGSQDNTSEIVQKISQQLPIPLECLTLPQNQGKGAAVRAGFAARRSAAEVVFFADADGATPAKEFNHLIEHWSQGAQVVIGSRALGTEHIKQHWLRRSMGKIFNVLFRFLMPCQFKDTQCGFKLFSASVVPSILEKSQMKGFAFDVEWLLIALANGFSVKEIPVWWEHQEASRVHIVKDSFRMLRDLIWLRRRWMLGQLKTS